MILLCPLILSPQQPAKRPLSGEGKAAWEVALPIGAMTELERRHSNTVALFPLCPRDEEDRGKGSTVSKEW